MSMTITEMLDEEYQKTLQEVADAKSGSEEAQWQLKKLTELHKQRMDDRKQSDEAYIHLEELTLKREESKLKIEQAQESKKDRIIRVVMDGLAILVPVTVSSYWMAKGLKFEENGTFTSRTGQWLSNHLRLFRK